MANSSRSPQSSAKTTSSKASRPKSSRAKTSLSKSQNSKVRGNSARSAEKTSTYTLPVVPTRGMVAFPFMVLPLFVGRDKSVKALEAASDADKRIILVSQRDENIEDPTAEDLFTVGTVGEIVQMMKMPDGNVRVVIEGRSRVRVNDYSQVEPYFTALSSDISEEELLAPMKSKPLTRRLKADFETAGRLSRTIPPEALQAAQAHDTLGSLSDLVVSYLEVPVADRQARLKSYRRWSAPNTLSAC
jgi:ATP-dependent Lon protease